MAKFWAVFHNIQVSPEYIAGLTQIETISRCKRKLAAKDPMKYGATKLEHIKNKENRLVAFQEYSFDYLLGEYIGMFLVSTTPLGIVFAYHKFTNKKQETKHAIQ